MKASRNPLFWDNLSIYLFSGSPWYGEGNGTPLQYSCLENPMDRGAWWAAVHGVAKSRTRLSNFTFTFHFHALEKEMATHSSVLAWRIPGMGQPGGLPSVGSHRVGHDWSDLAAANCMMLTSTLLQVSWGCAAFLWLWKHQVHASCIADWESGQRVHRECQKDSLVRERDSER